MKLFWTFALLFTASRAQVSIYGNGTADYGDSVHFRCALANPTGVLQVTWEKFFQGGSTETLATYSNVYGEQVHKPHQGKVVFTEASLTSTSITLKNVTWEDGCCYICSFNGYPDGSKRKKMCLSVTGISDVVTGVQTPSKDKDMGVVFSCSATGRPPPTIRWVYPPDATPLVRSQTVTVKQSDGTFVSSQNVTLKLQNRSGHVDCLLNGGRAGQRQESIHFNFSPSSGNTEGEAGRLSSVGVAVICCALFLPITIVVVALILRQKRLKDIRRNETAC